MFNIFKKPRVRVKPTTTKVTKTSVRINSSLWRLLKDESNETSQNISELLEDILTNRYQDELWEEFGDDKGNR